MNSTEGLKDEEAGILNEILKTSNQKEVVHKNLEDKNKQTNKHLNTKMWTKIRGDIMFLQLVLVFLFQHEYSVIFKTCGERTAHISTDSCNFQS